MVEITYDQLMRAGACHAELTRFRIRFGDRVTVTVEAAERYAGKGYGHWDWLADRFLTGAARWAEYNQVTDAARTEYNRVATTAWAEYDRVATTARAWVTFGQVVNPARVEFNRTCAVAFARLYIEQCDTP
jgi:hypothetical protein